MSLAQIWRHPIKAHGREALVNAQLDVGRALPFDRQWAVAHSAAKLDSDTADGWHPCRNFSRGASLPLLQAIESRFDAVTNTVTLTHPSKPGITANPDLAEDQQRLITWFAAFTPENRPAPTAIIKADNAMTDVKSGSISLINLASNTAVGAQLGQDISPLRWRGNLLIAGLDAWEEKNWVDRHIRIGAAEFHINAEITRCRMTEANPATGERDANTLGALRDGWNHQEMGVYATVTKSGTITVEDQVEVLS
ncbi:MOSC domain-containing protein [Rhodobacteraceae bacterium D3-12]|nr:MOSC domain-containing protein [Rhodobacteraceae bacterium D3-12]